MENSTFKLLVIDDIPELNALIRRCLKLKGYASKPAYTYQEAKELLEKENFDLITLDWHLDHGKTGFDLLPFIPKKTKVILVSTMTEYSLRGALHKSSKMHDCVYKLNLTWDLVPKVEYLLDEIE